MKRHWFSNSVSSCQNWFQRWQASYCFSSHRVHWCATIEIINNTRAGIVISRESELERASGAQIALEVRNTELCIRMDSAVFIV